MGIGLFGILFVVMFTLKLMGKIALSWWWVTAPLWGPAAIVVVIMAVVVAVALVKRDKVNT